MLHHLLSVYWNVDPGLFTLGSYTFRYYNILFLLGFFLGYYMVRGFFRRERLPTAMLDNLLFVVFFSTVIGARLGHCFFYDPAYFFANPTEILMLKKGGMASHGGLIGVLIGVWFFVKKCGPKYGFNYIWLLDRLAIPGALTCCFIRLGNLMNSEIYGVETSLPWGFVFAQNGETVAKHPTQIYEALCYLALFCLLLWLYRKWLHRLKTGFFLGLTLILGCVARFFIEFVKNPQVAFEEGMRLDMGQWLTVPFFLLGIGLLVYSFVKGKPALLPQKKK